MSTTALNHHPVSQRIITLARYAQIATLLGFILLTGASLYAFFACAFDEASANTLLKQEFLDPNSTAVFTLLERLLGITLLFAPTLIGIIALGSAFNLFAGYRRNEIFTKAAAARLRFIGWMVVLLSPVNQIAQTLGTAFFSPLEEPGRVRVEVSFTDTDIYAIVFGLLIVVIGHIMYEATNLSDENRSFV